MSRGGSDPFVERVREATDIAEVIGAHVQLKKAGSRLGGLCPFHKEKTPSFYVNPDLQAFHCFGCGVGGDVFTFIMDHEKMTFPEALRFLAERAGIPLPERRGPPSDLLERIREALRMARSWYRSQLEGPHGGEGRIYLDRRDIRPETREAYGLGLAPDAWEGLLHHARSLISERTLIEAGLAVESSGGKIYDRFRHRLMIPIETAADSPIGFGGRALGDQEPKYLNSPESPVYRKGSVLFGAGPAREGVRAEGRVLVVEGYFDVLALVQAGIKGVVGTCGTALTPEQATAFKRLSDRVVLLFDGDPAGLRASLRALPIVAGEVAELRVASPPPGKDPDLWVREEGPDRVRQVLDQAPGPLAYLGELMAGGVLTRRDAAARAVEVIARIADPLGRDLWIQEAASRFGVRIEAIHQALHQASAGRRVEEEPGPGPGGGATGGGSPRRWKSIERECVRSALFHPERSAELAAAVEDSEVLDPGLPELLRWIGERSSDAGVEPAASILARAARELPRAAELTALSMTEGGVVEQPEAILRRIRLRGLERRMEQVNREVRRAEEAHDAAGLDRALGERQELAQERARLAGPGPGTGPEGGAKKG